MSHSSLQNVTGLDEISSEQASRIGPGLRNVGAQAGKSEEEVQKSGQLTGARAWQRRKYDDVEND